MFNLRCPVFVILCLLLAVPKGNAQRIVTAKLYSNFGLNSGLTIPYFEEENGGDIIRYKWLSPAINYQYENNRYREWELTDFLLQIAPDGETDTRFSIGLRYEYGARLVRPSNKLLKINVGGSIRMFGALEQLNSSNIIGLPVENKYYGISMAITPHLEFEITKRLRFELSPYVELVNGTTKLEYVYDEFIDEDQRGSIDFYFKSFQTIFRFGLGWSFK
ncbi:MAG: hypothetical protein GC192_10580 [Bacteroidetes bacterium]|nr:hypothetical protein [Bacteroidota bacterium]